MFAGLAKAKVDWLGFGQPLNLWLVARSETPILGGVFGEPWFALAMSWAGFVFDTTIVVWLSWARTRIPAYVALILFHGLTGYLFNIGMFPLIMTSSALIFFSPSWPRRLRRVLGRERSATEAGAAPGSSGIAGARDEGAASGSVVGGRDRARDEGAASVSVIGGRDGARDEGAASVSVIGGRDGARDNRAAAGSVATLGSVVGARDAGSEEPPPSWVKAIVAAYVIVQIAVPLRHLVLPGNVLWNERGMRFAWHVLIREKHGAVTFVAELADAKQLEIPAHNYLTPRQEREMSGQPDLIVQLARHVAEDLRAKGYRVVAIRARAHVSLNGRAPEPMLDPTIDLVSGVTDRLFLPEPAGPPPHVTTRK